MIIGRSRSAQSCRSLHDYDCGGVERHVRTARREPAQKPRREGGAARLERGFVIRPAEQACARSRLRPSQRHSREYRRHARLSVRPHQGDAAARHQRSRSVDIPGAPGVSPTGRRRSRSTRRCSSRQPNRPRHESEAVHSAMGTVAQLGFYQRCHDGNATVADVCCNFSGCR